MRALSLAAHGIEVLAGLYALASVGCAVEDIVVAEDRAPEGGIGGPCAQRSDCGPIAYCDKPSCDAPQGLCKLLPVVECDDQPAPVCGCDNVNYWNDCMRRRGGVPAASPGECTTEFAPCGGTRGTACPAPGAYCAKLFPSGVDPCRPSLPGVCWVLPPACPAMDAGTIWQSCGHAPPACLETCAAIRSEHPFQASASTMCQ